MSEKAGTGMEEATEGTFRAMRDAFSAVADHRQTLDLDIAEREVRCSLAGPELADWIIPAFGHLVTDTGCLPRRLTAELFAEPGTGPEPPDEIVASPDGRFLRQRVGGAEYLLNREERHLVGRISTIAGPPAWERVKPLAVPLTVWLCDEGLSVIHAGLVSRHGAGILFTGPSGAGKSTCAMACAGAGFEFLGDDCAALDLNHPEGCIGYSLYATGALDRSHFEMADAARLLAPVNGQASRGKARYSLHGPSFPRMARRSVVRAIVLPKLTGTRRSRIRPATKGDTLRYLAPSSIIKRAVPAGQMLRRLARLAEQVPSYWLEMSRDPADIPAAVSPLADLEPRG